MSKQHAHLNHAVRVIETAKPGEPLSLHLKKYFSASSKFGSGDRRMISKLCYYYYRVANAFDDLGGETPAEATPRISVAEGVDPVEMIGGETPAEATPKASGQTVAKAKQEIGGGTSAEANDTSDSESRGRRLASTIEYIIIRGYFLCEKEHSDFLQTHHPDLDKRITIPIADKFKLLEIRPSELFPLPMELSIEIEKEPFFLSLLVQPLVYLRIRPGHTLKVIEHLGTKGQNYLECSTSCIGLEPNTKVDPLFKVNKDVVIQDRSSQLVFRWLQSDDAYLPDHPSVWDCCAAAGGKSMLMHDLLNAECRLTVSDKRAQILNNLKERFHEAGIANYKWFTRDLVKEGPIESHEKFDIIICDVPCSGSGTWSRTPEQMYQFPAKKIDEYQALQQSIIAAALPALKPGGVLFYVTCSVFKKENEDNVEFIVSQTNLQHLESGYIRGYDKRADTMFAGVFRN